MIDSKATIRNEPFYNLERVLFGWNGNRAKYRKSTYGTMVKHGQFPYVEPNLEGGLRQKKLDMVFVDNHWTHLTELKTEQGLLLEATNARIEELRVLMNGLDGGIPLLRVMNDHIVATGKRPTLPQAAQDKLSEMDAYRAEHADLTGIVADLLVDETEKTWIQTNLPTFAAGWNWLLG